jgi:hypothetical protein
MSNKLLLYWSIEINVILWMLVLGYMVHQNISGTVRVIAFIGFIFSAVLQHWAYHKVKSELNNKKVINA